MEEEEEETSGVEEEGEAAEADGAEIDVRADLRIVTTESVLGVETEETMIAGIEGMIGEIEATIGETEATIEGIIVTEGTITAIIIIIIEETDAEMTRETSKETRVIRGIITALVLKSV